MFALSIVELGLTVDSFQYLQKTHTWHSKTERARLAFLIFSAARTIALSAVYMGLHCAQKVFHSMFHTVSLAVFWLFSPRLLLYSLSIDIPRAINNLLDRFRSLDTSTLGHNNLQSRGGRH
jgi:hypothetical protein